MQIKFNQDRKLFEIAGEAKTKTLPEGIFFRLWGAEVKNVPQEIFTSNAFKCDILGKVYATGIGTVNIRQCRNSGGDLAEDLIRKGFGTELCSETSNAYGTCK